MVRFVLHAEILYMTKFLQMWSCSWMTFSLHATSSLSPIMDTKSKLRFPEIENRMRRMDETCRSQSRLPVRLSMPRDASWMPPWPHRGENEKMVGHNKLLTKFHMHGVSKGDWVREAHIDVTWYECTAWFSVGLKYHSSLRHRPTTRSIIPLLKQIQSPTYMDEFVASHTLMYKITKVQKDLFHA